MLSSLSIFALIFLGIVLAPIWGMLLIICLMMILLIVVILWMALLWLIGMPIKIKVKDQTIGYIRWFKFNKV